ncbi:MAG: bifunctional phosphoribosylaminoimidazolecarboxamide formyltransferase/IMP cyclohydrolase [Flavobacteriales bacterium]|nr:bifunctional phosphoribosylaminoimidazolecarboxamide formyltransferase/IMP cyclohydrolase [Flavobacteriales bacterium]MDG2245798.1 bifunctional phosphoribosylaminoimidazolecarboxamide formyltransferase/IMP cyclohydrolase [Flavobacteriales bacterium]
MSGQKKIKSALISVFHKEGLEPIVAELQRLRVQIYSTGGTQTAIEGMGAKVHRVEDLTSYPSILGGRVKTLHPKVFGGILGRRDLDSDVAQMEEFEIPSIDLVIVDLYPFEATVASGASHEDIIEKVDIGGISLIRAAAKNYKDVVIVASMDKYQRLLNMLVEGNGETSMEDRQELAADAFNVSSHYDTMIFKYFCKDDTVILKESHQSGTALRYGENPHQRGYFFGDLDGMFDQLHGKALSYNNLLDIDAAVHLMNEFKDDAPTFAILKHNNACGLATRSTLAEAYKDALAGDPVSAFGGVLISNKSIDKATADQVNDLFCEVVIAPSFDADALETLKSKKNRIILVQKSWEMPKTQSRTILNGMLVQDRNEHTDEASGFKLVTTSEAEKTQIDDLVFANKLVKHTKSNTIVFAKNGQLLASGTGQTSRVDALKQAVIKAKLFGFDLNGAVMASDAFFPFPDCVELACNEGVNAVVQPGGSVKDQLSIDFCNENSMAMYFTGYRHFKH